MVVSILPMAILIATAPRGTFRDGSVCFATELPSSGVSVYDTNAEARLHAAQLFFSLPCGLPLQSALLRFSLPCGQGLQSAQLSFRLPCGHGLQSAQWLFRLPCGQGLQSLHFCFTLPCGHRFTPIASRSRLRQGNHAPLASSRPVPRVVNASPRRKEASEHKQAFHAFGLRLASGFRIFACVGGVFLGSIAIHRDGTSSRASSATGPHSAHDVVGGSRHRPRARRGRAR